MVVANNKKRGIMKNLRWLTNTRLKQSDRGYTIIELLVIVIMLGVLSAIAAPGWLGFINRQRVRTVNDRVFQSLRTAQSEAKRTKQPVTIKFDKSVDPPTVTFDPPLATGGSTQTLNAGGEIKPRTIELTFNKPDATNPNISSIVFDYQGKPPTDKIQFAVTVAPFGSASNTSAKQCAIVDTLIGGMRTAEGNDPVAGCP
jgi:Tfp pilus assembly protein FimT